jgi:acyl-CoA thioesterase I
MIRSALALLLLVSVACDRPAVVPEAAAPASRSAAAAETASPMAPADGALRIVVVGDSLAAGYGLREEQAFPALVEAQLRARGWRVDVVNGGVSGDTTAGGLARLPWLLRQQPDIVVVELGANDGLRGLAIEEIVANLRQIVERSRQAGARVLLVGMRIPPNYGDDYAGRFAAVYPRLAEELGVPLMPFLLDGVGGHAELIQADGLHPNAEGQVLVADAVVPHLEPLVREIAGRPAGAP